jgi:hypothetical protein
MISSNISLRITTKEKILNQNYSARPFIANLVIMKNVWDLTSTVRKNRPITDY